jgi:4a-hydroxytetrahydrobiopterin dehydratase
MTPPSYTPLSFDEVAASPGLDDWRLITAQLRANFRAGSFQQATALAAAIAAAADAADHHPELDIRYPDQVIVTLTTHHTNGITTADVTLAQQISQLAATAGARAEFSALQQVEIALDTLDASRIRPFWAAVLGYREVGGMLVDPARLGPPMWFQTMTAPRTERQRFHIDVSVPHEQAAARIDAALAAGGRMVNDRYARSWWVLADADGNEACICTWRDRD